MPISIVLFIDRHQEMTRQCLDFIRKNAEIPYELIVIGNGAGEETIRYLQAQKDICSVLHADQIGIAQAYNSGLELAGGEYVLLMSHYSLLTPGSLSSMVRCLESEASAAIIGPVSNDVSGHQHIRIPYHDLSEMEGFAQANRSQQAGKSLRVFRLLSHCMLVRKGSNRGDRRFRRAVWFGHLRR
jgi:GT2 family glycosyltransferase